MFRIEFKAQNCVSLEEFQANVAYALSAGLPLISAQSPHSRRLAIVGGGPSILSRLDELRGYDDVWGINQTASYLVSQGIEATVFSVDSDACLADMVSGVTRGLLAVNCSPQAMRLIPDLRCFHTESNGDFRALVGPSSATRATTVALWLGFRDVTYYGCEGSYGPQSHAYRDDGSKYQLVVRAGGVDYVTQPDYMVQCESLAAICTEFKDIFRQKSGGLLGAMIEHPETWEVVAISAGLAEKLLIEGTSIDDLPPYQLKEAA